MPRRVSILAWLTAIVLAAIVLATACDLPQVRAPLTTRVVVVETPDDLQRATETLLPVGCVLTHLIADPQGPSTWAVFSCVDAGRAVPKAPGLLPMRGVPVQAGAL